MTHDIVLPRYSRKSNYARVVAWLRETGDRVSKGEPLLIMETDKATIELAAEASGVLTEILCGGDQWIEFGKPVGVITSSSPESDR